jgi:hypothetical protein
MKKGKTSKLSIFDNAKCVYGTVDSINFKSLYLNIQSWVEPKKEVTNWDRVTGNLNRQIKHTLLEVVDSEIFDNNFIVDLDLRSSGIQLNKKSFMNLEITFFMKDSMDFKSSILKERIRKIAKSVYSEELSKSEYFVLSKSKTKKD